MRNILIYSVLLCMEIVHIFIVYISSFCTIFMA